MRTPTGWTLAAAALMVFSRTSAQDPTAAAGMMTTTHHYRPGHYRTVCYVAGWAHYRPDPVQFHPEDVDTSLCTHLIFAFALIDKTGLQMIPADPADIPLYTRLTNLKREKSSLKVLLSVGGWTMGSDEFTVTVSSKSNMHAFAANAIEYLHRYNFDGLDVDWEYPGDRGSPAGDKQRFTDFLKVLRSDFARDHRTTNRSKLLLTTAISPSPQRVQQSYELPDIANFTDFINLMTYDLHGSWDSTVGHHSSLYSPTGGDSTDTIDFVVNFILDTAIDRNKLNLGLAFYGNSVNLTDPTNTGLGAPINGAGQGGTLLHAKGVLAYYEVCKILTEQPGTVTDSGRLTGTQAPYLVTGTRWTGYDDAQSIAEKVAYVMQHGLGGVFIWSIDMDDFHGVCGDGHYPLMNTIQKQYHQRPIGRR